MTLKKAGNRICDGFIGELFVHKGHIVFHARHDSRPLDHGMLFRIWHRMALGADDVKRLVLRCVQVRILRNAHGFLVVLLQDSTNVFNTGALDANKNSIGLMMNQDL